MQLSKLDRIKNMVDRKLMRAYFIKWVGGAIKLQNLEDALFKSSKTCYKNKLRNNFIKFRDQTRAKSRAEHIEARCVWLNSVRKAATTKDVWYELVAHKKRVQLAKRFLNRAINGIDRNDKSDAFARWKETRACQIQMQMC